jgi:IS5 family transposase
LIDHPPPSAVGLAASDFKKLVRWRTGSEGRISCLKRDFGLRRTRIDGLRGARTWWGHGIFAHNLVKIAGLLE